MSRDCRKDPCDLCRKREAAWDCDCQAGVDLDPASGVVRACRKCNLLASDAEAVTVTASILDALRRCYFDGEQTVEDAMNAVRERCGVGS